MMMMSFICSCRNKKEEPSSIYTLIEEGTYYKMITTHLESLGSIKRCKRWSERGSVCVVFNTDVPIIKLFVCVYVYYCSTCYKDVRVGGGGVEVYIGQRRRCR
jgi:hypothetical protein